MIRIEKQFLANIKKVKTTILVKISQNGVVERNCACPCNPFAETYLKNKIQLIEMS